MKAHQMMVASILRRLGQPVPDEKAMDQLLHDTFTDMKKDAGLDPDNVKYRFSLVEIDREWVDDTFGKTDPSKSRWK